MHLIEDTRQKLGQHAIKNDYWVAQGCYVKRCKLPWGDYISIPSIAVDTKADIYEIANNIIGDHKRFRDECLDAKKYGCQLVILVENTDGVRNLDELNNWHEPHSHFVQRRGKKKYSGKQLAESMRTMESKYGVRFEFCTPNEAGKRVLEILGGEAHVR